MWFRRQLSCAVTLLLPLTVAATLYLYLYPVFRGCAFPLQHSNSSPSGSLSPLAKLQQNAAVSTLLQHLRGPDAAADTQPAIFRLLVLADPQLEGDTSLPFPEDELESRIRSHWRAIQEAVGHASTTTSFPLALLDQNVLSNFTTAIHTLALRDVPRALLSAKKRLDLFGNDYYLAHIYRTLFWWTRPTHTAVLGDLVGSQWVTDEEYAWRGERYWTRVFRRGERVDDNVTRTGAAGGSSVEDELDLEPLGPRADPAWTRRIINIAGNHDVGYAGDLSPARLQRFERTFGRANWDIRFQHPLVTLRANDSADGLPSTSGAVEEAVLTPTLHLINLNSLVLDTPALSSEVQAQTYAYLNDVINHRSHPVEDRSSFTLLLTHLPLHKEEGICTDAPHFAFHNFDDDNSADGIPRWERGGLEEQNHLSDHASAACILQGIFGMSGDEDAPVRGRGRNGLILTGHDHAGCDVVHSVDRSARETDARPRQSEEDDAKDETTAASQTWKWAARRYDSEEHAASQDDDRPSIREVTLRSMMGEFGGNAGLLSLWFDPSPNAREWKYEISTCAAGVQHIWWAVHVLLLVTLILVALWCCVEIIASLSGKETKPMPANGSTEKTPRGKQQQQSSGPRRDHVRTRSQIDSKK